MSDQVSPEIGNSGISREPIPFELPTLYFHGTRAQLVAGDFIKPGHPSNFGLGRDANHVYMTATLDAAIWGAELAKGDEPGRIYIVEPTGAIEDDPNLTDKKFPGNPTRSFRSTFAVRVVGEISHWHGHAPEAVQTMRDMVSQRAADGIEAED